MKPQSKHLILDILYGVDASAKQIEAAMYQALNFVEFNEEEQTDMDIKQTLANLQTMSETIRQVVNLEASKINGT